MSPARRVKPKLAGAPEERLRYMLACGLKYAPSEGVTAAAKALLPYLRSSLCPREDGDCRPGACDCDGVQDALAIAISRYEKDQAAAVGETIR